MKKEIFTVKDVAEILKKSPQWIHQLVKQGKLVPINPNEKYKLFKPEIIKNYQRSVQR